MTVRRFRSFIHVTREKEKQRERDRRKKKKATNEESCLSSAPCRALPRSKYSDKGVSYILVFIELTIQKGTEREKKKKTSL